MGEGNEKKKEKKNWYANVANETFFKLRRKQHKKVPTFLEANWWGGGVYPLIPSYLYATKRNT